ncbi:MAG: cation:proton antiporter [Bacteroidetes bacterium]|nr:cation:proton antiporter [Bacteroidota bacterium]
MEVLLTIAVCLTISFALSELAHSMHYPRVLGQIAAGIIVSIPFIKSSILLPGSTTAIAFLAELGIVFLILLVGMEIDYKRLKKASKEGILVAIFGAIVPFGLGYLTMKLLGYDTIAAVVLGAALSITAPGTSIRLLMELKKLKTRMGEILIEAAIIDDLLAAVFLSLLLVIVHSSSAIGIAMFPIRIIIFILIAIVLFKLIPKLVTSIQKEKSEIGDFTTSIILALFIAVIAQVFGLGLVIGAFIAGLILQISMRKDKKEERKIVNDLKVISFGFIVPFFFIHLGLNLDLASIISNWHIFVLIMIMAICGKLIGAMILKLFSKLSLKQTALIGWGMNSRGAVELVIAEVARLNGLIPIEIYSIIIAMALITTFIFPFVLERTLKKSPHIME